MIPAEESDDEVAERFWATLFSDDEGDESRLFSGGGFARTCFCSVFAHRKVIGNVHAEGGGLDIGVWVRLCGFGLELGFGAGVLGLDP